MKYKPENIKECKEYLNYSIKNGFIDEDMAQELIDAKAWKTIYDYMDEGDWLVQKGGDKNE